jgi:hypothetical protein
MRFLNFPSEIRNQIYEEYFDSARQLSPEGDLSRPSIRALYLHNTKLWCLCSRIRIESQSLFYSSYLKFLTFRLETPNDLSRLIRLVPTNYWPNIRVTYYLESSNDSGRNYPTHSLVSLIARNSSYGTFEELEKAAGGSTPDDCGYWHVIATGDGWKVDLVWSRVENSQFQMTGPNEETDELFKIEGDLRKLPFLKALIF